MENITGMKKCKKSKIKKGNRTVLSNIILWEVSDNVLF